MGDQNLPDAYEHFVSADGKQKLEFYKDTKNVSSGTFVLLCEDHTMGNLVRCMLHRDKHVVFAGYRVAHPLSHEVVIRVQTDGAQILNPLVHKEEIWTPVMAF